MDRCDVSGDVLTASLLEEVLKEVESQTGNIDCSVPEEKGFLAKEYNEDLCAVLGNVKKTAENSEILEINPEHDLGDKECYLTDKDPNNLSDDPFEEGEGKRWITTGSTFKSSADRISYFSDGIPKNINKWKNVRSVQEGSPKATDNGERPKDTLIDPVFQMRIVNPKVSTIVLKERMIGREAVPPFKIKKFLEIKDLSTTDWVTGGAIVGKHVTKSQKGNPYCIWNLTDLKGDIKFISVYLFGPAYTVFWKLSLGTVVGILNPSVFENKGNRTEATLKVDSSDKIMVFGLSKDYGVCKSKKSNGGNCTAVVNKSSCEYCVYHVKQAYNKASRRPELQANFTGKGLTKLHNKVLGKNEVFYGGKSYMATKGRQILNNNMRERERVKNMIEISSDRSKIEKDNQLLKRLNGELKTANISQLSSKKPRVLEEKNSTVSFTSNSQKNEEKFNESEMKSQTKKMIDLNLPITNKQMLRARANAIKFVREKGPLKKPVDGRRISKTPEQIMSLKRKIEAEEDNTKPSKKEKVVEAEPESLLKQKMKKIGITEKFLQLMNVEIKNKELLNEAETEERNKYFSKLEIKEKMEEKMASTYKIDCKAVRCLKCNYKSFSASELCKKEKHPLKLVNAVKRFFKCHGCSNRTVALELIPLHSCKVCGSSNWEKASMLPEKKAPLLPNEALSIRGHEEKFVGSTVRNPNINLLVPDQET